jgi:hypothetical protein
MMATSMIGSYVPTSDFTIELTPTLKGAIWKQVLEASQQFEQVRYFVNE